MGVRFLRRDEGTNPSGHRALGGALVLLMGAAGAYADALPVRKPGLWEVTLRSGTQSVMRQQQVQQCTDRATDQVSLMSIVPGQEHCHQTRVKKTRKGLEVNTTCWVHDNRVEAQIRLLGDFQKAYEGQFEVKYSKPVRFNPGLTHFTARWLGECKPGQRPADMVLPNGVTVNVVDDLKTHQGHDGHDH